MKIKIVSAAAAAGIITAIDAQARSVRRRSNVGLNLQVALTWDGVGNIPPGWSVPYGILFESGGLRVAIIGTDDFAENQNQFLGAVDILPADWNFEI